LREIFLAEIPESVYNSNAIENSTLSLKNTEKILLQNSVPKELNIREVYEAKNFALLLSESLHKRIAILTSERIIPLNIWAKRHSISGNSAANKAKRQTIPAFRIREKWMISGNFHAK